MPQCVYLRGQLPVLGVGCYDAAIWFVSGPELSDADQCWAEDAAQRIHLQVPILGLQPESWILGW